MKVKSLFWGCCGGIVGLVIAVTLTLLAARFDLSPWAILLLWPTSIFGAASNAPPSFSTGSMVMLAFMYGGQFVIYGVLAAFWNYARHEKNQDGNAASNLQ